MKLDDIFSRQEAADMVGLSVPTVRVRHDDGLLVGIPIGQRPGPDGEDVPMSFVYTRRMIDAYLAGGVGQPTAAELNQIMDTGQVREATGLSPAALKKKVFVKESLPSRTIGGVRIFLRGDVEKFIKKQAQIEAERNAPRVEVIDGRVGDLDLAAAVAAYRAKYDMSQQALANEIGSDMSQLRQVISRIERRQTVRVLEDVYGRLVAIVGES